MYHYYREQKKTEKMLQKSFFYRIDTDEYYRSKIDEINKGSFQKQNRFNDKVKSKPYEIIVKHQLIIGLLTYIKIKMVLLTLKNIILVNIVNNAKKAKSIKL